MKEPYENMKDGVILSWHGSGKVKIWSFSEKTYSIFNYEFIFYDLKTLETSTDKFNEYKDRFWNKVYTYENVSIINEVTKMKIQKIFNTTQIGLNTFFENIKNKHTKQQ